MSVEDGDKVYLRRNPRPLRLDLQLLCTYGTPAVRKNLGCWPALPLVIDYRKNDQKRLTLDDEDNIFAALEQRHRVRHINLTAFNSLLKNVFTVMKEPFPALTHLELSSERLITPKIPRGFQGGFLGRSAPRLREISFSRMSFPAPSPDHPLFPQKLTSSNFDSMRYPRSLLLPPRKWSQSSHPDSS
jgi:hypothetical protein